MCLALYFFTWLIVKICIIVIWGSVGFAPLPTRSKPQLVGSGAKSPWLKLTKFQHFDNWFCNKTVKKTSLVKNAYCSFISSLVKELLAFNFRIRVRETFWQCFIAVDEFQRILSTLHVVALLEWAYSLMRLQLGSTYFGFGNLRLSYGILCTILLWDKYHKNQLNLSRK